MMHVLRASLVALILLCACQSSQITIAPDIRTLPRATKTANEVVLDHKYFVIHYSLDLNIAKFVKYSLSAQQLRARVAQRKNRFFADPILRERGLPFASPDAYQKSGYQRGHLAPAEDFRYSQAAIDETFVMSNMTPQKGSLNTGLWKKLEEQVRRWACGEEKVTVITGPVLGSEMEKLPSGIPIPTEFFKLVIDETPPRKSRAFILKQTDRGRDAPLADHQVSLSELETRTREKFPVSSEERQPAQADQWKENDCTPD